MNYSKVFMRIRQWIRFFLKKCHPPPSCCFAWKLEGMLTKLTVRVFRSSTPLGEIFVSFWKFEPSSRKSTKFVFEFCGLDSTGRLAPVDIATLSCFNQDFLRFFARAPCPLLSTMLSRKTFRHFYAKEKFGGNSLRIHFLEIILPTFFGGNPFVDGIF
jgi:hypothetical protein